MNVKRESNSHWMILSYNMDGTPNQLKPKKSYNDDKDAIAAARRINAYGRSIHKMVAYKCNECGKWHVGHNYTILTDKEKKRCQDMIKNEHLF